MWALYQSISTGRLTDIWTLYSNSNIKDYEKPNPGLWRNSWTRCSGDILKTGRLLPAISRSRANGNAAKAYKQLNPCLQHSFFRQQSSRGSLMFQERNQYIGYNRFNSGSVIDWHQECEHEWVLLHKVSRLCACCRPTLSWQCRDSIEVSARVCPNKLVTYMLTVYGYEPSIRSEHAGKQELHCSTSDLQQGICDLTKCRKTKCLSNNLSRIQLVPYYSGRINFKHPLKQERNNYVLGTVCYGNDCGKNCLHLLFLNTLALKDNIDCGIQRRGSNTCQNEAKVEMLTTELVCISACILVYSSKKCLHTLYEATEILCLQNIAAYHRYILIAVKVIHSDGECNRLKRGSTAKQNGVSVFPCLGSSSFNSALAKPS
jgi:hypothetical protein